MWLFLNMCWEGDEVYSSEKWQSKAIWCQGSCKGEPGCLKAAGDGAGFIASLQAVA